MRVKHNLMMICILSLALGLALGAEVCPAADMPPAEGTVLPDLTLPASKVSDENNYLGVRQEGPFKVQQIRCDILILEIFNMYCPYCQREAPNVNELYNLIANRKGDGARIKIVGIGVGNSPFEVQTFKKAYNVPFPLFPDNDFTIHKALGQTRTPYFVGIKFNPDGTHQVIYSRVGSIGEPREFLELILKQSRLK